MKKINLVLSWQELATLHEMIKLFRFDMSKPLHVLAFHILAKVYLRITTRLQNPTGKPSLKFSLKQAEAVSLSIILIDVYDYSNDEYYKNVALRINNTINQNLA